MEVFRNVHLWAAAGGWFFAEIIKVIIHLIVYRKLKLSLLFSSGGMPSSHSSVVAALCTVVALTEPAHMASPLFAVCCVFAYVVMYDAAGVRRAAGEHAKVLNQMKIETGEAEPDAALKELIGHTPLQVVLGCLTGIVVGLVLGWAFGYLPYAA